MNFGNFEIEIIENIYYRVKVHEEDFSVEDLKKLVLAEKELSGQQMPVLVLCNENASTNVDLLREVSKNQNNPFSVADAFVISSTAQRIMANFYLKIYKPERPTKFFNNADDALFWLKQFFNAPKSNPHKAISIL